MDSTSTIDLVVARIQRDETIDDPIAIHSSVLHWGVRAIALVQRLAIYSTHTSLRQHKL